jgi:rubrerythrin
MRSALNHQAKEKDYSENQRLKNENKKLKRQLERLRKQLSRIDLEVYTNIKEAVEAQQREDVIFEKSETERNKKYLLKKQWECHKCGDDYLRLLVIQRLDGDFYFRKCPACGNRTKIKPFTENVKGPRVEE